MGKRRKENKEEPLLFDLPLQQEGDAAEEKAVAVPPLSEKPETGSSSDGPREKQASLFDLAEEAKEISNDDESVEGTEVESFSGEESAPLLDRLLAGFADLMVHAAMLGSAAAATVALGVPLRLDLWPPFAVLGFVLSFLYWTVPLAFWGQTPGMAWIGNSARSIDDEPLSFGQAVLRWIGALTTVAFGGLPVLLALGGRSLTDRMSDSKTLTL